MRKVYLYCVIANKIEIFIQRNSFEKYNAYINAITIVYYNVYSLNKHCSFNANISKLNLNSLWMTIGHWYHNSVSFIYVVNYYRKNLFDGHVNYSFFYFFTTFSVFIPCFTLFTQFPSFHIQLRKACTSVSKVAKTVNSYS